MLGDRSDFLEKSTLTPLVRLLAGVLGRFCLKMRVNSEFSCISCP